MLCFNLFKSEDKSAGLLASISRLKNGQSDASVHAVQPSAFGLIPCSPFAYWVSNDARRLFTTQPRFEQSNRNIRVGLATTCDPIFVRLWVEVMPSDVKRAAWIPYAKGGSFSRFYQDIHLVVDWENEGNRIKARVRHMGDAPSRYVASEDRYLQPGLTYPRRTQGGFNVRAMPQGCIFANKGPSIFVATNHESNLLSLLGLMNSEPFRLLLSLQMAFGSYEVGVVQRTPVPELVLSSKQLAVSSQRAWQEKYFLDIVEPISHAFLAPALLIVSGKTLSDRASAWKLRIKSAESLIARAQGEIDDAILRLYGLEYKDLEALAASEMTSKLLSLEDESEDDDSSVSEVSEGAQVITANFIAYLLGSAFARWDIRYATGENTFPNLPGPFAPLPVCPLGQLQNSQGLPAQPEDVPASYPIRIPWDGILVDDRNHSLDIEQRIREVIEIIWSSQEEEAAAEAIENEACDILGVKTLRDYFRKPAGFFANHLKCYSKSRRQAPIYWQLSAGNGNYSAWIYYHRFTKDTLYRLLGDFVEPRIQEAEREQFEFESQGGLSGDAAGLLHEVQALLQDLRLFKSELELVAPLWNPNLNDGVIINHAILWRITPYTPWQKKCKECWDKLVKGDYDWAHLAFHLWPERVIKKCQSDRSLAIAHGLEERLWQETNNGNWLQRQVSEAELQALLAEYSKPAVQNALERFLAASPPVAAARTRAPRAAKSSSTGATRKPRGSAPGVDAETSRQTLLVLTAAPTEGLGRNAIAELLDVEAASLTAVIKQLKEAGQIEQLGAARGAMYRLSESGLAAVESQAGDND